MNPFDALLVPPALVKRAFEDLHEIAQIARRVAGLEDEFRLRLADVEHDAKLLTAQLAATVTAVEPLSAQLAALELRLDAVVGELAPIRHLDAIRAGIEPLEKSMIAVRESVDELEPMIEDLDKRIQLIEPRLAEMQESVEPIGDLAERVPGNRRRRSR